MSSCMHKGGGASDLFYPGEEGRHLQSKRERCPFRFEQEMGGHLNLTREREM